MEVFSKNYQPAWGSWENHLFGSELTFHTQHKKSCYVPYMTFWAKQDMQELRWWGEISEE